MKKDLFYLKGFLAFLMMFVGLQGAWADTATKTEGFEAASTGTNYQSTVTVASSSSDCGIGWEIYYGCVSTSSKISGNNSAALRLYSNSNNYGYIKTTTAIDNLTNVTLNAKASTSNSANILVNVLYSTDGTNWTAIESNKSLKSSSASYSWDIPSGGKYFQIAISSSSTKPKSNSAQLTIDDVVFTYTAKTLSSLAISGTPTKTTYEAGEAFAPTGLVVTGTYSDNSTADVTSQVEWDFDPETLSVGTTSVDVVAGIGTIATETTTISGLTVHASNKQVIYAKENSPYPYRIPALAQNKDGKLIAIADNRPSGVDIGSGEVDLVARIDNDGTGTTWGTANIFADGSGGTASTAYGYGDAAVVADRESNKVLVMGCYATTGQSYYSGNLQTSRLLSTDGGSSFSVTNTWTASDKNTLLGTSSLGSFYTSGRILQSQYTKVGSYYRIYSALCVQDAASSYTSNTWVAYSDDFGSTWSILGGGVAVTGGNEAKLEELPDGRIVVSSRKANGRYFNIFTYTNTASGAGSWGTQSTNATIAASDGTGTNGEILIVPAKDASNNEVYIALQSAPAGGTEGNRSHVSVYYKVLDAYANFNDPSTLANGWTLGKELSSTTSAYSTMILQSDGNIGVLYEDNETQVTISGSTKCTGYDIVYNKFALSELASGYTLNTSIDRQAFLKTYFTAMKDAQTDWTDDVKTQFMALVNAISATPTTAQMDAIYSFDPYDGKTVTLTVNGYTTNTSSTFTKYIYTPSTVTASVATSTASTDDTATQYQFIMKKQTDGSYTFQSVSNPSYYLGVPTSNNDKMCLSTTAIHFTLVKSGGSSSETYYNTMSGYALQYARVNSSAGSTAYVCVSNATSPATDCLTYTSEHFKSSSNYFSTDFTIEIVNTGYTVTCNTAENGSVTADKTSAAKDATVTLTIAPSTGYELDALTVTNTTTSATVETTLQDDGTYTFTMPESDVTVSATFKALPTYTIACTATNGTVTTDKETATAGETVTLTVTPNTNYGVTEVTVYDITSQGSFSATKVSDNTYTFTMPSSNVNVNAVFLEWTTTGSNAFHENTWSVEGDNDGTGMTTPFIESWVGTGNTLPDQTITYVKNSGYTAGTYQVSILARMYNEGNTTDALSGTATFNVNSTSVDMLSIGTAFTYGSNNGVYGTYTTTAVVGEDGILDINFNLSGVNFDWIAFKNLTITKLTEYNITCSATNGEVSASATTAIAGTEVTLTFTANDGYLLKSYSVTKTDDATTTVEVTNDKFTMPDYDVTVSATFESIETAYDGYVVTLGCTGTSFTTPKYLYNNKGTIGVEALSTVPTDHKYQFIMKKGTNGYTLMSLSDPYYYVVLTSSNSYKFSLATTGTAAEFTLTKNNKAANCGYTAETMTGYALQYTQPADVTGDDGVRFVAINADGTIDKGNYTTEYLKTTTDGVTDIQTTYSTDFTIQGIHRYALTSDTKNVYVYHDGLDNTITNGAHGYLGDYGNYVNGDTKGYTNSLAYVEDQSNYVAPDTTKNVVIKAANASYACANLVLHDKVDVSIPIAFTAANATYKRADNTDKYGTLILPYVPETKTGYAYLELTQEDVDESAGSAVGGYITFTEITGDFVPNTPYLYRNTTGKEFDLSRKNASVVVTAKYPEHDVYSVPTKDNNWNMVGVYEKTSVFATQAKLDSKTDITNYKVLDPYAYYIKDDSHFAKVNGYFNSPAFRAYFSTTVENSAKFSTFSFVVSDETPTNIIGVEDNGGTVKIIYDLSGRKINEAKKGQVNIINGKKVLVK